MMPGVVVYWQEIGVWQKIVDKRAGLVELCRIRLFKKTEPALAVQCIFVKNPGIMTRLTLEIKSDRDLAILTAFLKLLNVKVLKQEREEKKQVFEPAGFYKNINVDLNNFKFNRDEANER